jgi:hypothetical protein
VRIQEHLAAHERRIREDRAVVPDLGLDADLAERGRPDRAQRWDDAGERAAVLDQVQRSGVLGRHRGGGAEAERQDRAGREKDHSTGTHG